MMPVRTVQRRRTSGDWLPNQLPFDPAEPPARLWRNAAGRVVRKQIGEDDNSGLAETPELEDDFGAQVKGVSHTLAQQFINRFELDGQSDLLDSILACCETDEERAIVGLRIQGYTDDEIGEQVGLSRATVNRRRKEIETRMKKARSD